MKKLFLLAFIGLSAIVIYSCKKNTPNPATASTSQWIINGNTYKAVITGLSQNKLVSDDSNNEHSIEIWFGTTPVAGNYPVINIFDANADTLNTPANNQCIIRGGLGGLSGGKLYASQGGTGDHVTVTVSNGKVTASFSDIKILLGDSNNINPVETTVSGTLVQP